MRFRKYHGIGNDFVLVADLEGALGPPGALPADLVAALCDRHTGVGADGVIRILGPAEPDTKAAGAALRMDYYNADGGEAEMCGNGIRCLAILARSEGWLTDGAHPILTGAGVRTIRCEGGDLVAVDMGRPSLQRADVPMAGEGSALRAVVALADGTNVEGTGVSMGNPHFVLFADDLDGPVDDELIGSLGPALETHSAFPKRTNVEFVEVASPTEIRTRVWERGVGETRACGTGACAVAVAAAALERTGRRVEVHLPGGALEVVWGDDDVVWMTGPAEEVFAGEIDRSWLKARGLRPLPVGTVS